MVNHYYADSDTYAIVDAVSNLASECCRAEKSAPIAEITREDVWEMYGVQLITYTMELGWDEMIRYLSPDLKASQSSAEVFCV